MILLCVEILSLVGAYRWDGKESQAVVVVVIHRLCFQGKGQQSVKMELSLFFQNVWSDHRQHHRYGHNFCSTKMEVLCCSQNGFFFNASLTTVLLSNVYKDREKICRERCKVTITTVSPVPGHMLGSCWPIRKSPFSNHWYQPLSLLASCRFTEDCLM